MFGQAIIMKLAIVVFMCSWLCLVSCATFTTIPLVLRQLEKSQRLVEEVQGIDYHAGRHAVAANRQGGSSQKHSPVQGRMASSSGSGSLSLLDCDPSAKDNTNYNLCCHDQQSGLLINCGLIFPSLETRNRDKLLFRGDDWAVGSRRQQPHQQRQRQLHRDIIEEATNNNKPHDDQTKLNLLVDAALERLIWDKINKQNGIRW